MGEMYHVDKAAQVESFYGTWTSPITSDLLTLGAKRFENIVIDGEDIYWGESRPSESGRSVIVRYNSQAKQDMTPTGFNVRTRVHEYGGGAFTVSKGTIYFVNEKDQRIYVQEFPKPPQPLTEPGPRFADLKVSPYGILAVCEIHHENNTVDNELVLIDRETGKFRTIASGYDFYSSPTLSPDGKKIAWISWKHPNMPWDGCELWMATFEGTSLKDSHKVAGGPEESIFEPQWSPDNTLYFVSDKSGWWNLYRLEKNGNVTNIYPLEAEFGLPQWAFGMSTWAFAGNDIISNYRQNGMSHLLYINPLTGKSQTFHLDASDNSQIRANEKFVVFLQGSATESRKVVLLDLKTQVLKTLARDQELSFDPGYLSIAQPIEFPSANGRTAYGYYYPPQNKDFKGPKGELPPLIVKSHGGPTASVSGMFSLGIQYWTSRGFAILDVNYGGSTGYGRKYRQLLQGNWGVVDVEDCEYGAQYLVKKGLVDPKHLIITGGSAGGYTTLAALVFGSTFTLGSSYYGVSDLTALAKETHKFESRYLDGLIGPYPEKEELYRQRSPSEFPEKLSCPVIFFQGLLDKVVPPNQAEMMYQALQKQGILSQLVEYPDEGHGFRKAENIRDSVEKELAFYLKVFYQ